ncbi:MAG: rhomboid family intramembrane serine protease [Flavobacteriales bacterium]|nr:rhomboid family intramembrane serine protease [Flavobacteriales bacterium]
MALQNDLRMKWHTGGMTVRLILINVAVFVAMVLAYLLFLPAGGSGMGAQLLRDHYVVQWLRSTADLHLLATRPWTVLTYMFVHTGLGHIFWNMILLWFGGRLFEDLLGGKRLLGHYLLGGLSGLALYVAVNNAMPGLHVGGGMGIMGASAGVLSVFIGIAAYRPEMIVNLILIGPVKLMYVAAVFLLLDLVGIGSGDGVAHEAHIGGALYGFIAARQLTKGRDWSLGLVNTLEKLTSLFKRSKAPRMRVEKRPDAGKTQRHAAAQQQKQARIDAILDKISRSGYDSLSKEEKDLLFKASNDQ